MIKYTVRQYNNEQSPANGLWYAYPVVEDTVDLAALAQHMEQHNTGFSEAMCLGMMTAMVKCIKEQLLEGKNVKIDNLAIFSVGIRNKVGAKTEAEFSAANISGVKLRARATGTLSNANLNTAASMRKAAALTATSQGGTTSGGSTSGGSTSGGSTSGDSTSGGSTSGDSTAGGSTSGDSDSAE